MSISFKSSQRESEQLNKNGFEILLIGHKNHPEVIGTMGQLPNGSIKLIETINDVELLKENDFKKPLAYITQTTLSVDDTAEIIKALKVSFQKSKALLKRIYVTLRLTDSPRLKR